MKRHMTAWMIIAAILVCASTLSSYAQNASPLEAHFRSIPLHPSDGSSATPSFNAASAAVATVSSVPMWNYATTASRDGRSYSGSMVGRSPFFHGARTTSIDTILVPVKITFKDTGTVFDPNQTDPNCLPNGNATAASLVEGSPVLMPTTFTMNGVEEDDTQYVDSFQRANFFNFVNPTGNSYHTLLNLIKTTAGISTSIAASAGKTVPADTIPPSCAPIGVMNVNTFQGIVEKTLIPALAAQGVGPTTIPIFLLYNAVMSDGIPKGNPPMNCCILGFHSAVQTGSKIQLYAVADYDSSRAFQGTPPSGFNSAILSHEIAELTDDPLGNNLTPAWGGIGQVENGCQNNLEVGDPLSGTFLPEVTMPNGITYDVQELAFYSWFFGAPSIGAGGVFSDNGNFVNDAGAICH